MSLRRKREKDEELAASAPLAVGPADGVAFRFGGGAEGGAHGSLAPTSVVHLRALGVRYECVLVENLADLPAAVALLEADVARGGGCAVLDGEFDTVFDPATGRNKQRLALCSLLASSSQRVHAFHFPRLFDRFLTADGRWDVPLDHAAAAPLFRFLVDARVVTWAGDASDLPALAFSLPRLPRPTRFFDLQRHVAARIRRGELLPTVPVGLARAAISELGVTLDKSFQISNWRARPTAAMCAYAAGDVIVL